MLNVLLYIQQNYMVRFATMYLTFGKCFVKKVCNVMVNPFPISSCIVRMRRSFGIFSSTFLGFLGLCHVGLWIFYLAGWWVPKY